MAIGDDAFETLSVLLNNRLLVSAGVGAPYNYDPDTDPTRPGIPDNEYYLEDTGQWWKRIGPNNTSLDWELVADVGLGSTSMQWKGNWAPGTYYKHETVYDQAWTMICTAVTTTERAAPQIVGSSQYSLPTVPVWDTPTPDEIGTVRSGQLYTFTKGGWVKTVRVWVPLITEGYTFQVVIIHDPFGPAPYKRVLDNPLTAGEWNEVGLGEGIVNIGDDFLVYINSFNSITEQITHTFPYEYHEDDNRTPDKNGHLNRDSGFTELKFFEKDEDGVNRETELLETILNSTIRVTQIDDPTRYWDFQVNALPTAESDGGDDYIHFDDVTKLGSSGIDITQHKDCIVEIISPTLLETEYVELEDYWLSNMPNYANVIGGLQVNGVLIAGKDDHAYGIDLEFQEASVSADWQLVSHSGFQG